jgi:hypothetical protein
MSSQPKFVRILLLTAGLLWPLHAKAAVILSSTNYSENFDEPKLSDTAVTGQWTGTTQASVPGTSGWDGVRIGGSGSAMNYSVGDGTSNSGAIYSYGSAGSTERALGALASGTNIGAVGVELQNQLAGAITQVTIDYTGEFWRSSTSTQNVLTFGYSVGAPGSTTYLASPGTAVAALNLVGPAPVASNGLLDGNLAANRASFGATFNVAIPVGQSLYLRWQDANDGGNDAGLAIDGIQVAAVIPEPTSLVLGFLGLIGISLRVLRRSTSVCE